MAADRTPVDEPEHDKQPSVLLALEFAIGEATSAWTTLELLVSNDCASFEEGGDGLGEIERGHGGWDGKVSGELGH
jgi:hypothetical protein